MDSDNVLDVRAAAAYLKINDQTLRRLAKERRVPAFKVGGTWRFKKDQLDNWAEAQSNTPATPLILVVDDEETVRNVLKDIFETNGYNVALAQHGLEALQIIDSAAPDLVFLDLKMPEMDGSTTFSKIREKLPELPIVILTGFPDSDCLETMMKHDPVMLLTKPAKAQKLLDTADLLLRGSTASA